MIYAMTKAVEANERVVNWGGACHKDQTGHRGVSRCSHPL